MCFQKLFSCLSPLLLASCLLFLLLFLLCFIFTLIRTPLLPLFLVSCFLLAPPSFIPSVLPFRNFPAFHPLLLVFYRLLIPYSFYASLRLNTQGNIVCFFRFSFCLTPLLRVSSRFFLLIPSIPSFLGVLLSSSVCPDLHPSSFFVFLRLLSSLPQFLVISLPFFLPPFHA